jgi:hypothetical protein
VATAVSETAVGTRRLYEQLGVRGTVVDVNTYQVLSTLENLNRRYHLGSLVVEY